MKRFLNTPSLAERFGIAPIRRRKTSNPAQAVPDGNWLPQAIWEPLPMAFLSALLGLGSAFWQAFGLGGLWIAFGLLYLSVFVLAWSAWRYWVVQGSDAAHRAGHVASGEADSLTVLPNGEAEFVGARLKSRLDLPPGVSDPLRALRAMAEDGRDLETILDAARQGRRVELTIGLRGGMGRVRLFVAQVTPRSQGGADVRFIDVSGLHGAAETERAGRKWFSDYLEAMPIGVFAIDDDGLIVYANALLRERLGLEAGDVQAGRRRFSEFTDVRERSRGDGEDWLTLEGIDGRFRALLSEVPGPEGYDGPERYALLPAAENAPGLADTEAPQSTGAQTVAGGGFRALFEDAPVGVLLADAGGAVTHCNRAFYKMLGQHRDLIVGKTIAELVSPEDRADLNAQLSKIVMGTARVAHLEVKIPGEGERSLMTSVFAGRLEDALGEMTGLVVHVLDNTERKNLEEQFGQSQKMQAVGQLAGGVAHDFNNLLTAMIGFTDLLLGRHGPNDPDFADLQQIKQNANRATNLVRQLLAFSRKQKLKPEVMDPAEALNDLQNLLSRLIGEPVKLVIEHRGEIGLVRADRGQFDQVIINLVVNARDAMPGGGNVSIQSQTVSLTDPVARGSDVMQEGDYVLITVADTGCGIAKEDISRIFEPFFSTKDIGQGTGLGLSTVYGIVHQSGGFIFVDSALGEGTTFSIYLPVDELAEEHQDQEAERATEAALVQGELALDLNGGGTVFMVEDEQAVRTFAARALRSKGYEVIEAEDGEDALDQLNDYDGPIDLILSDISMPGMDGKTLVRLVRDQRPDIKIILMSGYADDLHIDDADQDIAEHFLAKPFTLKALAEKVKQVLG